MTSTATDKLEKFAQDFASPLLVGHLIQGSTRFAVCLCPALLGTFQRERGSEGHPHNSQHQTLRGVQEASMKDLEQQKREIGGFGGAQIPRGSEQQGLKDAPACAASENTQAS